MNAALTTGLLRLAGGAFLLTVLASTVFSGVYALRASHAETKAATSQAQLTKLQADAATQAAQASEIRNEAQRLASRANTKVTDELQRTRMALGAERNAVERRLRERAEQAGADAAASAAGDPAGTGRTDDAAALGCLSAATRNDLVGLAADAQSDAADLAAAQRYIREVVPLCQPAEGAAR